MEQCLRRGYGTATRIVSDDEVCPCASKECLLIHNILFKYKSAVDDIRESMRIDSQDVHDELRTTDGQSDMVTSDMIHQLQSSWSAMVSSQEGD